MYIYTWIFTYKYTYVYMYSCIYVHTHARVHMCVHVYVCARVCVRMYACVCVNMHIHMILPERHTHSLRARWCVDATRTQHTSTKENQKPDSHKSSSPTFRASASATQQSVAVSAWIPSKAALDLEECHLRDIVWCFAFDVVPPVPAAREVATVAGLQLQVTRLPSSQIAVSRDSISCRD